MACVRLERHGAIAEVVLDRPEKLNAITQQLLEELVEAGDALRADDGCRAVVLHGAGRAFCAGIDLQGLGNGASGMDLDKHDSSGANLAQRAVLQWRTLPIPVIAAIHGFAFGGGLQLTLGADIRIVHPQARLSVMEARWGLIPDMAGTVLLPELVGHQRAAELTWTARQFTGEEAVRMGLCLELAEQPLDSAMALAHAISQGSAEAVRGGKRLLNHPGNLAERLREESRVQSALLAGEAHRKTLADAMATKEQRAQA